MLRIVLEKMLLEEEFMINTMNELEKTIDSYKLTNEEEMKIVDIQNKILKFFNINDDLSRNEFFESINTNSNLKEHFIEYANEKFTYLLASERTPEPVAVAVVWCAGMY